MDRIYPSSRVSTTGPSLGSIPHLSPPPNHYSLLPPSAYSSCSRVRAGPHSRARPTPPTPASTETHSSAFGPPRGSWCAQDAIRVRHDCSGAGASERSHGHDTRSGSDLNSTSAIQHAKPQRRWRADVEGVRYSAAHGRAVVIVQSDIGDPSRILDLHVAGVRASGGNKLECPTSIDFVDGDGPRCPQGRDPAQRPCKDERPRGECARPHAGRSEPRHCRARER